MSIINRYLAKDLAQTLFAVIMVLMLIAVSNKLVSLIPKVSSGEVSQGLLLKIIFFQLPELFSFLLPLSLFLAIIFSFGRAFVDNELTVLFACGFGWQRLLILGLGFVGVIFLVTGWLNLVTVPTLNHAAEKLMVSQEPGLLVDSLVKGRFYSFNHDKLIFYVNGLSPDKKELSQVFIVQQPKSAQFGLSAQEPWTVLTAMKGEIKLNDKAGYAYLELTDGTRYEGIPGKQDYNIIHFGSYSRLIEKKIPAEGFIHHRAIPTKLLISSKDKGTMAELQARMNGPLSVPILMLLAVPLSRVSPRAGRYARLLPAIVLFIVYYNFLAMNRRWVASGLIPVEFGFWWVHAVMLGLALYMNLVVSGRARQFYDYVGYWGRVKK